MSDLIKIKDVSSMYDISARTLRYYEEMGLISSTRNSDYAYRLYDHASMQKLEQILILRKLSISVRDIKRIFDTAGSKIVLEVLSKKADDIDVEVALLHELKSIVLEFINHIKQSDFSKDSDVKLLYDKAKEIETNLTNVEYTGNTSPVNRLLEVTEKLDKKVPDIMVVKVPPFRAVTSGLLPWDKLFDEFGTWNDVQTYKAVPILFDGCDFLTGVGHEAEWFWRISDEVTEADVAPYTIVNQPGGLYAVIVSVDGDGESHDKARSKVNRWLETTNFVEDDSRRKAAHMIYVDDDILKGLGYHQLNLYLPIKLK
ncbi:MAG: MerR family transcriptional regulator [Defluviitaleaceae bacterium]|nr:MerR family transcriptional regulator [Defluviitaleaceae bacterium]